MAGYSGTPLVKKLGIKEGHRLLLLGAPSNFGQILGELPESVTIQTDVRGGPAFDVIVYFTKRSFELQLQFDRLADRLTPDGSLWIAWPKKASGVETDLSENVVRAIGLKAGLVDNKVCAIDEIWSGLRFVVRVKDRTKKVGRLPRAG